MEKDLAKLRFVGTSKGTTCVGHICDECISNGGKYSSFGKILSVVALIKRKNA